MRNEKTETKIQGCKTPICKTMLMARHAFSWQRTLQEPPRQRPNHGHMLTAALRNVFPADSPLKTAALKTERASVYSCSAIFQAALLLSEGLKLMLFLKRGDDGDGRKAGADPTFLKTFPSCVCRLSLCCRPLSTSLCLSKVQPLNNAS